MWMTEGWLGETWKPEISKFVMSIEPLSRYMLVQVDPGQPKSWRQEPYYSQFQRWAEAMLPLKRLVIVFNNKHGTVITAQGEMDLGIMGPEDRLNITTRMTQSGPVYDIKRNKVVS